MNEKEEYQIEKKIKNNQDKEQRSNKILFTYF